MNRQQKRQAEREARRAELRAQSNGQRPPTVHEARVQSAQQRLQQNMSKHTLLIEAIEWCDKAPESDDFANGQAVIWTNELDELASDVVSGFAELLEAVEAAAEAQLEPPSPIVVPSDEEVANIALGEVQA